MKPSELLVKAQAVIADPEHWTQDWYARDAKGHHTGPSTPEAVCWCSIGAIDKVAHEEVIYSTRLMVEGYLARVADDCGYSDIPDFNDNSSHEAVMKAWDEAIRLAKEDEK